MFYAGGHRRTRKTTQTRLFRVSADTFGGHPNLESFCRRTQADTGGHLADTGFEPNCSFLCPVAGQQKLYFRWSQDCKSLRTSLQLSQQSRGASQARSGQNDSLPAAVPFPAISHHFFPGPLQASCTLVLRLVVTIGMSKLPDEEKPHSGSQQKHRLPHTAKPALQSELPRLKPLFTVWSPRRHESQGVSKMPSFYQLQLSLYTTGLAMQSFCDFGLQVFELRAYVA